MGGGGERDFVLIKAGRYTHMNVGAIQVQWIWRSREIIARGMSV